MKRERLGAAESVNAIKDKKIDAFFWVGGLPTAAVTDLGATPGVKIKLVDHADVVEKMNAKYGPLYVRDVIPAKTYPGQDKNNAQSTVWNILVTDDKMTNDLAYAINKLIFDRKADLVAVHSEAANIDYKYQVKDSSPVPWHPGALKYFADSGVKM
jgi:TRAP transporter TAXI family solute receptor